MVARKQFTSLVCGLMFVALLSATSCSDDTDQTSATTTTSVSSTTADAGTSAVGSSTELSAGSYTGTVDGTTITYQAAYLVDGIDATIDGGTYDASSADEVVFLVVNGGSLTVEDATIEKSGDASTTDSQRTSDVSDSYNFYGMNSAIVVIGEGSSATVAGTSITTSSEGSNAVVAVDGSTAEVTDTSITTSGGSSRGLHATFGGTITGSDLTIATAGAHSADVATDRGGGSVTVSGTNQFSTAGEGSPLVYSTGTIEVSGVEGTATTSEVVVVEGKNSATITGSTVGSGADHAVMIYQSMSGDAPDANAAASVGAVTLEDTTVTFTGSGSVLYFTNTSAAIQLNDVTLDTTAPVLASAQEDRWGTSGSNGATVTMEVSTSELSGTIEAGSSSQIDVTTKNGGAVSGTTSGAVTITDG